MNILFLTHEADLGGASRSLLGIIDELSVKHNIYVLTAHESGSMMEELKKRKCTIICGDVQWWIFSKKDYTSKEIMQYRYDTFWRFCCYMRGASASLLNELKQYHIDIVHSNTAAIYTGVTIAYQLKIPHIWHLRESVKEDHGYNFAPCQFLCMRIMNQYTDCFIAVSQFIKNKYSKRGLKKIKVIYDGVCEVDKLCINNRNWNGKGEFNLLLAGTLCEGKGQKEAVLAVEEVLRRKCKKCRLYLAGGGEDAELKEFIKKRKLRKYIKILGYIDNMDSLRKNIDVTLMCSSAEAFGRVTIESMKVGIPVIGADTGGTVELIQNGENGYLYHKGNHLELADCIERLYKNPNILKKMKRRTLDTVKGKFTQKENAREIEKLYYKVIETYKKRG